jgi:hypothetical protein
MRVGNLGYCDRLLPDSAQLSVSRDVLLWQERSISAGSLFAHASVFAGGHGLFCMHAFQSRAQIESSAHHLQGRERKCKLEECVYGC